MATRNISRPSATFVETANQIQDTELKGFVQQMGQKHQQIFQSFYGLL